MHSSILDPYRLRQFVAVAEQLNITRAAADLHLTQQAVSITIKNLERDLGTTLFERSRRSISLTPSGITLLRGAKPLLEASAALAKRTRAAVHGARQHVTIGLTSAVTPDEVFELTAPLRRTYPEAGITARQLLPDEVPAALRSGAIDVGLRRDVSILPDLATATIAYTPLQVAVSASHRHATRSSVALHELAHDTLILPSPPEVTSYADFLISLCRMNGFEPRTTVSRVQGISPSTIAIDSHQFTFVTAPPGLINRGMTVILPLDNGLKAAVQAVWRHHESSDLLQLLVAPRTSHEATVMTPPER